MRGVIIFIAFVAVGCREPRWTLWETRGNETTRKESGLERQACETLRDQAERNEREVVDLLSRLDRQLVAAGRRPEPTTRSPISYRCRPDGSRPDGK